MGLPAFDMSAFEAAQAAATRSARVSTAVFVGPEMGRRVREEGHRVAIRKDVDAFVDSIDAWRSEALGGTSEMRSVLQNSLPYMSIDLIRHAISRNREMERIFIEDAYETEKEDQNVIDFLANTANKAATISTRGARFLRGELKRLRKAADLRAGTNKRLLAALVAIRETLSEFLDKNSVAVGLRAEEAGSSQATNAVDREAGLADAAERTARLLRQFPKTAAYLAR